MPGGPVFEGFGSDYELSQDALYADGFVSHCWAPPENWTEVIGKVRAASWAALGLYACRSQAVPNASKPTSHRH